MRSLAGPLGLLALRSLLPQLAPPAAGATVHIPWTMGGGVTLLFVAVCAVAGWLAGYGIGYRRGVNNAIDRSARKPRIVWTP